MADKEATVFIVDLGSTMANCNNGRTESDLDWSMRFLWDKISHIVSLNRKTLCAGVIGLRTDETSNSMAEEEGYANISVLQPMGPMVMSSLKELSPLIKPSSTDRGDAISAIVLAVEMINTFTKQLKYNRKIILVTDGLGPLDGDDLDDISQQVNEKKITLTILGVDFDDPAYGFKEEDKPSLKAKNEATLRRLVDACEGGMFGTVLEAIEELDVPVIKPVRPYKSYDGTLTLGNPDDSPAMVVEVERYFKVHSAAPLTASTVVVKANSSEPEVDEGAAMEGVEFSAVKQARTYKVNDPDAPGGKKDVEFESLAKGYEYGRTAVHISESEYNITKLETTKEFTIVGFIEQNKYDQVLDMGESGVTIAKKFDVESAIALSAFIQALDASKAYAVARLVAKDGKEPLLVLLAPDIAENCLYDVPLPFAEDVRNYQFPPLDKVITLNGTTITKHRFLPGDELNQAMSDYVDAMDLSSYAMDEDGNPAEYATVDENFNPVIHRIIHAVKNRAVHPDGTVPSPPEILTRFSAPPQDLIQSTQAEIDALIQAAEVKKVPPKAKGKRKRETVKPLSGLDVDALLNQRRDATESITTSITPDNAIPTFIQALSVSQEMDHIRDATRRMADIVRDQIRDSFGDALYASAVEKIGVMRRELIALEEPGLYNDFMRDLKPRILSGELNGDRRDMWWEIRIARLGLIHKGQSEFSDVTLEDADEFIKAR